MKIFLEVQQISFPQRSSYGTVLMANMREKFTKSWRHKVDRKAMNDSEVKADEKLMFLLTAMSIKNRQQKELYTFDEILKIVS